MWRSDLGICQCPRPTDRIGIDTRTYYPGSRDRYGVGANLQRARMANFEVGRCYGRYSDRY
jgi:hypothetical protein